MKYWRHFKTITHHKWLVLQGCFRVGLYWQGLTHDLSKYSPTEFRAGMRYYQGTRSPNTAEREAKGYSEAWMHHKGRNRHHYEYWTDISRETRQYESVEMPRKYFVEMIMDRRAACIVYQGENYRDDSALIYFDRSKEKMLMHPETRHQLSFVLKINISSDVCQDFQNCVFHVTFSILDFNIIYVCAVFTKLKLLIH